jgi:sporulation protein YlmC with PRC-barrel domain
MTIRISDLYGKKVISTSGSILGVVKGVILDMETGAVAHLLFDEIGQLMRSSNLRGDFHKNSVSYDRVTRVSETIVVKSAPIEKK